jgi:hypothetical protein
VMDQIRRKTMNIRDKKGQSGPNRDHSNFHA